MRQEDGRLVAYSDSRDTQRDGFEGAHATALAHAACPNKKSLQTGTNEACHMDSVFCN